MGQRPFIFSMLPFLGGRSYYPPTRPRPRGRRGSETLLLFFSFLSPNFPFCHIISVTFLGKKVTKEPSGEGVKDPLLFLCYSA